MCHTDRNSKEAHCNNNTRQTILRVTSRGTSMRCIATTQHITGNYPLRKSVPTKEKRVSMFRIFAEIEIRNASFLVGFARNRLNSRRFARIR